MKWLVDSLRGDSNVQWLLHFLEIFHGLIEVNRGESNSLTRNFFIVLDCKYNREVMAEGNEGIELKFRIFDGTDIGHGTYSLSMTVATLKQRLFSEWPQDKSVVPKSVNDMKLIHAGTVLENGKTLAESRILVGDLPGVFITMHVVVQPPLAKRRKDKKRKEEQNQITCGCTIL